MVQCSVGNTVTQSENKLNRLNHKKIFVFVSAKMVYKVSRVKTSNVQLPLHNRGNAHPGYETTLADCGQVD